uniref:Chordin n=1 Tax=Phallusia mammillata TaxID=59560 RepID=A0A6F9D8R4_9ASCI|nr:chordin [Phallusia mammillata]
MNVVTKLSLMTCYFVIGQVECFFPLRPEMGRGGPIRSGVRGCTFGLKYHAIGSSWHPNLGNTFGIMFCVTCHCVKVEEPMASPFQVGRSKVMCHDVRKDCEPVTCKNAKVPRGECCKVCPDDVDKEIERSISSKAVEGDLSARVVSILGDKAINDEDSKSSGDSKTKHFVSLLTSASGGALMRATFTLHRGNLHFTLHHPFSERPNTVELLNHDDTILYDHVSGESPKPQQSIVCGVWRNLPKNVLHSLDRRALQLKVTFDTPGSDSAENATSTGRIIKHRALSKETFSSLLSTNSNPLDGSRGALVMMTLGRQRFTRLHFAVVFRKNSSLSNENKVALKLLNENGIVLRKTEKTLSMDENEFGDVWPTNSEILRRLGEGTLHLELTVGADGSDGSDSFTGNVTARVTCDLLQVVLSGNGCAQKASTGAAGSAIVVVNPDNTVSYKMSLVGLSSAVTSVSFLGDYRKKRTRVIADVTSQYENGKAEGRLETLNGKELHLLLSEFVRVRIETEQSNSGELGGKVTSFLFGGHLARYRGLPTPLAGALVRPPVFTGSAGHAWLELNDQCHLYYEIVVDGLSTHTDSSVAAHLHGLAEISGSEINHKQLLKGFYGSEARGVLQVMNSALYEQLDRGTAFIQIATKRNPQGEIRGRIHIPNQCSQVGGNTKVNSQGAILPENNLKVPSIAPPTEITTRFGDLHAVVHDGAAPELTQRRLEMDPMSCYSEGRWRADGSQWSPSYDQRCTKCVCEGGSVVCDPIYCPRLTCSRPVALENECCPVCNDGFGSIPAKEEGLPIGSLFQSTLDLHRQNIGGLPQVKEVTEGCYDENDGKMHSYGSSWTPYFPMFGLVACLNCTCRMSGEITCGKVTCPPVTCKNPRRESRNQCCKTCPEETTGFSTRSRDPRMQDDSSVGMCSFGRDLYARGDKWSVTVPTMIKRDCVECECLYSATGGLKYKCKWKCARN